MKKETKIADNGQKGKTIEQIAQEAYDKAVVKMEKAKVRLEQAKLTTVKAENKRKDKALKAKERAKKALKALGWSEDRIAEI